MAEDQDKPKPPKLKITRTAKSVKLPKVKLSNSQARGSKEGSGGATSKKIPKVSDTSRKIPKVGLEAGPKKETARIKLPPENTERGPATVLRRAKLASDQPIAPDELSDQQQQNAEKSTTVRIEIDTAILRSDKQKARAEKAATDRTDIPMESVENEKVPGLEAKEEDKGTTKRIDPDTLEDDAQDIPEKADRKGSEAKSATMPIDPNLVVDDSQEIPEAAADESKSTTMQINPEEVVEESQRVPALEDKGSEEAKSATAEINPADVVEEPTSIGASKEDPRFKAKTLAIDPSGVEDQPGPDIPVKEESPEAKAATAKIDPSAIEDESQPIGLSKDDPRLKAATIPIDPADIEEGAQAGLPPAEETPEAKAATAQIDPSAIEDESQPIGIDKDDPRLKATTIQIDPAEVEDDSGTMLPPEEKSPAAKAATAQIDPSAIEDESQSIGIDKDDPRLNATTIQIDPAGVEDDSQAILPPEEKSPAAKAATAEIDPTGVEEDSQEIEPPVVEEAQGEEKSEAADHKSTQELMKATTLPMESDDLEGQEKPPVSKAPKAPKLNVPPQGTAKLNKIKAAEPEAEEGITPIPEDQANKEDLFMATTMAMDADVLASVAEEAEETAGKPDEVAETPKEAVEKPEEAEGITPIPEQDQAAKGDIYKATTMAMDMDELESSLEAPEDVEEVDLKPAEPMSDDELYKATTMAMNPDDLETPVEDQEKTISPKEIYKQVTQPLEEAPSTVKIKKAAPVGGLPKTVKLKKGQPAPETSKVEVETDETEGPKKTVKLKRSGAPGESQAGSGLRIRPSDTEPGTSPAAERIMEEQLKPTGTDGPNLFMTILSVLTLITSGGAIFYLWKALDLYKNF